MRPRGRDTINGYGDSGYAPSCSLCSWPATCTVSTILPGDTVVGLINFSTTLYHRARLGGQARCHLHLYPGGRPSAKQSEQLRIRRSEDCLHPELRNTDQG